MDKPASMWAIDHAVAERDYTYLSKLIGEPNLPRDVREHLALMVLALLTKKIEYPAHRPAKSKTFQDKIRIGARVAELRSQGVKKPIQTVAVEEKCSQKKVEICWAVYRDLRDELQAEKHRDQYERDAAHEAARESAITQLKEDHGEREFTDEEVSDEIDAQQQAWAEFNDW